ncbi:hypothetical protein PBRA_006371 [Plasmodiophora brassicae]|uniref:Uncharacterized protein n=1 Tax=Plasmodiophora brassicae TaxID=37360 RepID=A0A0G4ISQ5_PLABS|nr:hypothetical protein PBRA_006371 [Plasmodiophora brassicae]
MLFDLPAPPTPRHSSNLTGLKQLIFETMVATPGKLEEMQQQQRAAQWPRYPDSPVSKVETIGEMLSDAASDVPSQHDWLEDTIVHRSDRNEIDEQLDNEIDAMDMTNGEETSGPVNDAHSKKEPIQCQNAPEKDQQDLQPGAASILPAFHPLASKSGSERTSLKPEPSSLEPFGPAPLDRKLSNRSEATATEQFQGLRRDPIVGVVNDLSGKVNRFGSMLSDLKAKSDALDDLAQNVSLGRNHYSRRSAAYVDVQGADFACAFQAMLETTSSQYANAASACSFSSPTPGNTVLFTAQQMWGLLQLRTASDMDNWGSLLANFRQECVVPLSVDIPQITKAIHALFSEALELMASIRQSEDTVIACIGKNRDAKEARKSIFSRFAMYKSRIRRRSISSVSEVSALAEFENEIIENEIERVTRSEQYRKLVETFVSRHVPILSQCRQLNQKRLIILHDTLRSFVKLKHSWIGETLSDPSYLQNALSDNLWLEKDLGVFETIAPPIGEQSSEGASCSDDSVSEHGSLPSRISSVGEPASRKTSLNEDDEIRGIVRNFFLCNDRPRSYVVDMWGTDGFRRSWDLLQKYKVMLSQLCSAIEGMALAMEMSSKQMRKAVSSHEASASKFFNSEAIQSSWLALLDSFNAEAQQNKETAKILRKGISMFQFIQSEGRQLRSQFSRTKNGLDKQITELTEDVSRMVVQKSQAQSALASARAQLDSCIDFKDCPDQRQFKTRINAFVKAQTALFDIQSKCSAAQRNLESLQRRSDSVVMVFLQTAEDCTLRHYEDTKRIIFGFFRQLQSLSNASRTSMQTLERMVQSIDTETDLREFIHSIHHNRQGQESSESAADVDFREQIDVSSFDAVRSKSSKGVSALRFLISIFQEASTIDDSFVRILRKYPFDISAGIDQSNRYSSLTNCLVGFQKTMECIQSSIDERSSRMKEIAKSLRRQKSIIKSNILDIVKQNQTAVQKAVSVETAYNNVSTSYKKAVEHLEKLTLKHEKSLERERSLPAPEERRQSFIATMIHGRLPQKNARARMDSAIEIANRTQRALDHASNAWKEAISTHGATVKCHLQTLQSINTTRINAVKWAFTTHCEHQTFYGQQLSDNLAALGGSIDRVNAQADLNAFIRANGSTSSQPPDSVMIATLDRDPSDKNDSAIATWEEQSYCETVCDTVRDGDLNSYRESTIGDAAFHVDAEISVDSSSNGD